MLPEPGPEPDLTECPAPGYYITGRRQVMAMGQVQRHLKTEELYREILALLPESVVRAVGGETVIRGKLDAILTLGKIEGRLSAYTDGRLFGGILPDNDRLLLDWQRIVEAS